MVNEDIMKMEVNMDKEENFNIRNHKTMKITME